MQKEVTIVQVNDVHGYLDIHPELFYENGETEYRKSGGYARIAALLKDLRRQSGDILLLDSGDTFHGTFPVVDTKGEILIPVLNSLGFTAMTGHWDFAYGPEKLQRLTTSLNYPFIAGNVYYKDGSGLAYPPWLIREVNGLSVGIIGIACNIVDKTMPASFSEGLKFTTGESELPRYIKELKDDHKTDLILLLSHNGFPQDAELAKKIPGIDLILSGHTHNRLYSPFKVNETLIIQSGSQGSFAGIITAKVDNRKIQSFSHELREISENIIPDAEMNGIIMESLSPYEFLRENAGKTGTDLNRGFNLETTMDNFLLGSIKNSVEADVYFSNGWRYGAPVPEGDITLNDLYNIVPMDPEISTTGLTGREISEMIEENLENTFSNNPLRQMGGYVKRTLGLRVSFKVENPAGSRIQYITINGTELHRDKVYKAAFITEQGVNPKYGSNTKKTGIHAIESMKNFLHEQKTINTKIRNTFIMI
jgi:2',3'-cyclic-nucleotide 2'-phosphodiesterase (5'-nucleotidase family)